MKSIILGEAEKIIKAATSVGVAKLIQGVSNETTNTVCNQHPNSSTIKPVLSLSRKKIGWNKYRNVRTIVFEDDNRNTKYKVDGVLDCPQHELSVYAHNKKLVGTIEETYQDRCGSIAVSHVNGESFTICFGDKIKGYTFSENTIRYESEKLGFKHSLYKGDELLYYSSPTMKMVIPEFQNEEISVLIELAIMTRDFPHEKDIVIINGMGET